MVQTMCIGVDLDNTIICYDGLFSRVASEKGLVLGGAVRARAKHEIKSEIESQHGSATWTVLQGEVYGLRLSEADPFPGVVEFFRQCRDRNIQTRIISHKTEHPALGPRYDLRRGALAWLEAHGWFDTNGIGLPKSHVEFHAALAEKLSAIGRHGCRLFIDDLPGVLTAPGFPPETVRVLFDPRSAQPLPAGVERVTSWNQVVERFIRTTHDGNPARECLAED